MPTAHLVHGFPGVGKTTFAKQLERRLLAVRFSHDEWMVRFFGIDPPADLFPVQSRRVTDQIRLLWPRCLDHRRIASSQPGCFAVRNADEPGKFRMLIGVSVFRLGDRSTQPLSLSQIWLEKRTPPTIEERDAATVVM
jgi:DNA polymerase III delta prime subunit